MLCQFALWATRRHCTLGDELNHVISYFLLPQILKKKKFTQLSLPTLAQQFISHPTQSCQKYTSCMPQTKPTDMRLYQKYLFVFLSIIFFYHLQIKFNKSLYQNYKHGSVPCVVSLKTCAKDTIRLSFRRNVYICFLDKKIAIFKSTTTTTKKCKHKNTHLLRLSLLL